MTEYVVGQVYIIDGVPMRYIGNNTFSTVTEEEPEELHKRFDDAGPIGGC